MRAESDDDSVQVEPAATTYCLDARETLIEALGKYRHYVIFRRRGTEKTLDDHYPKCEKVDT